MNNRFGLKEMVLAVLLLAVLVSVWFAIEQYDRQWGVIQQIQSSLKDQSDQLQKIDKRLAQGAIVQSNSPVSQPAGTQPAGRQSSGTQTASSHAPATQSNQEDPFYRLHQAQAQPGYTRGGWLIDSLHDAPGQLTPVVTNDAYSSEVQSYVLQSLAQRDPDTLKWHPLIARSWVKSKDGLTFTFNLRHDVTFSDGQPLTSADIVYTYNLIMNPQLSDPSSKSYYKTLSSVKANGPYQVVFKLSKPYYEGFGLCAEMAILPKHFYSKYSASKINEATGLLMGSGPYQLQQGPSGWTSGGGQIVLVRNKNYWGVPPALDHIVFKIITDDTARLTAFTNGELDTYSPQPSEYQKLKDNKTIRAKANLFKFYTATGGYRYIGWNEQRNGKPTFFADSRVRQAMTLLINRPQMCTRLMRGLAKEVTGPFNPLSEQYNHNVKPWPYDPARARKLLKKAGYYDRNGDGVIDAPSGKPFEFKLIYPANAGNYQHMALYLKDAYAEAGIIMHPDPLPFPVMIQRMQNRDFAAITLGWGGTIEGDPYQIFDSHSIDNGGDDYVHYVNHTLDKIIETARYTPDKSKRMNMWHQVHAILHEDQPYTFLFIPKAVSFVSKRMKNVKLTQKMGINDPREWFVPKADQKWEH